LKSKFLTFTIICMHYLQGVSQKSILKKLDKIVKRGKLVF